MSATQKMQSIFEALSSLTRRKILSLLSAGPLAAGQISEGFDMSKPALSKHLSILENAGLVRSEKKGQFVYYSLVQESLTTTLYDFVSSVCPITQPIRRKGRQLVKQTPTEE